MYHRYRYQYRKGESRRERVCCSLCRQRVDFAVIASCELPPAKKGVPSGLKEIKLCSQCLDIINGDNR